MTSIPVRLEPEAVALPLWDNNKHLLPRLSISAMATPDMSAIRTAQGLTSLRSSMLETGLYSGLTIKCWERSVKVHRIVIWLRSKPLAACVEGDSEEFKIGVIALDADEPEILEKMIHFMYTQDYSDAMPVLLSDIQLVNDVMSFLVLLHPRL